MPVVQVILVGAALVVVVILVSLNQAVAGVGITVVGGIAIAILNKSFRKR